MCRMQATGGLQFPDKLIGYKFSKSVAGEKRYEFFLAMYD